MKNVLIGLFVIVLLVIVGAFLLLGNINSIVRQGIEIAAPHMLQVPVNVDSVDISVLSGRGEIRGLRVGNPEGYQSDYAFSLDKVLLELDPVSVITGKIHVKSIVIDSPSIVYEGDLKDSNIQQLQRNVQALVDSGADSNTEGSETASREATIKLQIDHIEITHTNAAVSLSFLSGEPLLITIPDIELENIGQDGDLSLAETLDVVLVSLNESVIPAIHQNAGGITDQLQGKGKEVEGKVKKGLNKLKSLLGN